MSGAPAFDFDEERRGRFLQRESRASAVSLLRRMTAGDGGWWSIEAKVSAQQRRNADVYPQGYLAGFRKVDSRELEASFAAILCDFVGGALAGAVANPAYYEALIDGDCESKAGPC